MPLHRSREVHNRQGGGEDPGGPVRPQRRTHHHPLGQRGPEFIAKAVKRWLATSGVKTLYIDPGSPWENAYSETFTSRLGDELPKREVFTSLLEAKVLIKEYRNHYNRERPHSALGYRTPAQFAASCEPDTADEDLTPKELESTTVLS